MSSASKNGKSVQWGSFAAAMALILGLSMPALAQSAPAFSETPTPPTAPLAVAGSDTPDSYVDEGAASAKQPSGQDVMNMLRDGNSGKPLSIAELAIINDSMKRMDYMLAVQRKMAETGEGTAATPAHAPGTPGMGGTLTVLRVSGSGGNYQAVVTNGQQQTIVKEGDTIAGGRVSSINLSGVRVATDAGSTLIPFTNPFSSGITLGR